MNKYKISVYTSPTIVRQMANNLRELGFSDITEGTEHVYLTAEGSSASAAAWDAQVEYEKKYGRLGNFHFKG